jgi:hypothetical protein
MNLSTKILIGVIILLIIGGGIGGLLGYRHMYQRYAQPFTNVETQLNAYQEVYGQLGGFSSAYVINGDFSYGTEIMWDHFSEVRVPNTIAPYVVTSLWGLVSNEEGKKFWRVDVQAGQFMTEGLVADYLQFDDMRSLEVNVDHLPVGLYEGQYVDLRISFPNGQDFIFMPHRRVNAIYGVNLISIDADELDHQIWNSIMIDRGQFSGTLVYAARYLSGNQQAAEAFYPFSRVVLDHIMRNPNVRPELRISDRYDEMVFERQVIENAMAALAFDVAFTSMVTSGRSAWSSMVTNGQQEYLRQRSGGW